MRGKTGIDKEKIIVSRDDESDVLSRMRDEIISLRSEVEKLSEENRNLEDIFETVREGIAYTTLTGEVVYANDALLKIIDIPEEKILGHNIVRLAMSFMEARYLQELLPNLKKLVTGTPVPNFTIHYRDKILEVGFNINFKSKRLTGTLRDVTEKNRTDRALKQSENRLLRAELASGSGNWELHLDTGEMLGSEGACKLYGIDSPIADFNIVREIPLPECRQKLDTALNELIRDGKPYNLEFQIKNRKTGEIRDLHSLAEYDPVSRIVFGVIHDITERKKNEDIINKRSRDMTTLLEMSMELLETLDRKQLLKRIIESSIRLMGLDSGAIYSISGEKLYLEATLPPLPGDMPEILRHTTLDKHPHIARAVLDKTQELIFDARDAILSEEEKIVIISRNLRSLLYVPLIVSKQARGILILGTVDRLHFFDENEIGLSRTMSGLASLALENAILFENLVSAKEKAEESDRLKTAFLQNISHEIRTPLNAIIGFSNFLNQPGLSELERNQFTEIIFQSNNQLLLIINDILSISQLDTGQIHIQKSKVDLLKLLSNLYQSFNETAARKGLDFKIRLPAGISRAELLTDQEKLKQIISYLLDNALKFTDKGFIELGLEMNQEYATFIVKDSGIGIDSPEHGRIFQRFYRIEPPNTTVYGGTGLGLTIAQEYCKLLGGIIQVRSEIRKGSEFSFSLPLHPENPGFNSL